jgi:hypothetical protein
LRHLRAQNSLIHLKNHANRGMRNTNGQVGVSVSSSRETVHCSCVLSDIFKHLLLVLVLVRARYQLLVWSVYENDVCEFLTNDMAFPSNHLHTKAFSDIATLHNVYSSCNPAFTEAAFVSCHSDAFTTTARRLSNECQFRHRVASTVTA